MVCARVVLAMCSPNPAGESVHQFDISPQKCERTTTAHPLPCLRRACPADLRRNGRGLFPQARCGKRLGRFRLTRPLGRHAAGRWGHSRYHPPDVALCVEMGTRPLGVAAVPTPGGRPHPLWWKRGGPRYEGTRPLGVAAPAGAGDARHTTPPSRRGRGRDCRRRGLARGHGPDF